LSRQTKIEKIAQQLNISKEEIYRSIKLNNTFKLLCLVPFLLVIFWALSKFLQKGLNISKALAGTGIVAVLTVCLCISSYYILSLLFNNSFFMIKGLLFAPY
jgi:hypothetical protein